MTATEQQYLLRLIGSLCSGKFSKQEIQSRLERAINKLGSEQGK